MSEDDLDRPLLSEEPSQSANINTLKGELQNIQSKLATALTLYQPNNEPPSADGAGYVEVEFVKTKPSMTSKLPCTKDPKVKTILHDFTAEFPEGCITALMGPSGAGKTTLLDFVTGMLGSSVDACGQVCLPDNDAYVPQDDRLHGFYTCQNYMEHYARLSQMKKLFDCCEKKKNSSSSSSNPLDLDDTIVDEEDGLINSPSSSATDALIAHILEEVGLSAQKDTPVGGMFRRGLSGGQKRRLSVALEALSSPMNLFLDEPTSGLDSESAFELMEYLKTYARKVNPKTGQRHRVIITIHQPSSRIWELIDNVVLLAKGRLIYQGRRTLMDSFFASCGQPIPLNFNPADHFIEALSQFPKLERDEMQRGEDEGKSKEELWSRGFLAWSARDKSSFDALLKTGAHRRSTHAKTINTVVRVDPEKRFRGKRIKKSSVAAIELSRRAFANLFKNPIILGLRVGIYGGMSVFIGMLFFNLLNQTDAHSVLVSRTALLYFILAFGSSMSVAGIPFAMVERDIVAKEVRNKRFHPVFYHMSQALVSVPVCFILSIIIAVIIKGMTGLGGDKSYLMIEANAVLFFVLLCADATSMFIAHVAPDMISAICIATGIFGLMTMVMGFIILPSAMPAWMGWLYYFPFMTYGFKALMTIQFGGEDLIITAAAIGGKEVPIPGDLFLKDLEIVDVKPMQQIGILAIWWVCMHLVSVIYLFWNKRRNKRIFVYSD